jgi:hypothetical protein
MTRSTCAVVVTLCLALPSPLWGQWRVTNNLDERFTVTVWPENNETQVRRVVVPRGETREIRLGQDRHLIHLLSGGGNIYILEPATLRDERRPTLLKDILTPKGRRNGRTTYAYMNQNGFNESDDSADIQNLSRSSWDSQFTLDGNPVDARINFTGDGGNYRTNEFTGQLSQVRIRKKGNQMVIDGQWNAGGNQQGPFVFKLNEDLDRFEGQWSTGGQNWQPWTGTQIVE